MDTARKQSNKSTQLSEANKFAKKRTLQRTEHLGRTDSITFEVIFRCPLVLINSFRPHFFLLQRLKEKKSLNVAIAS